MGCAVFTLIIQEKDRKKFPKNRVFYERKEDGGIAFNLYRLTYNNKRFLKKAKKLCKKAEPPAFLQDHSLCPELIEGYTQILEYNLFLSLCRQRKFETALVCDPEGRLCFRLDDGIKNLSSLKILTKNAEIYEEYAENLLALYGTCPLIDTDCSQGISYHFKAQGNAFVLGQGGFRADINSVSCSAAQHLCPFGVPLGDFFTLVATYCAFPPLLCAVPKQLVLDGNVLNIETL